jgi:hypothetical protein
MDGRILWTVLILLLGAGAFLRLVAKEKHRRERYLQFQLEERLRKQKEAQDEEPPAKEAMAEPRTAAGKVFKAEVESPEPALTSAE